MDKLIEYCQARYQEEVGFKFGLANIFAWFFFVTAIYVRYELNGDSAIAGFNGVKVKSLIDLSEGVIPSLTMMQLMISIAFVLVVVWLARKLGEGLFYLFCLKSDFQKLIVDMTILYSQHKDNVAAKKDLGISAKTELEKNQQKLKRSRVLAEMFLAMACCCISVFRFDFFNVSLVIGCFMVFLVFIWRSFHYFISDVLPYFVAIRYSADQLTLIQDSFSASQD
ncbi:hypothetical protein [Pseudomonas gessardii]|uniref:hypothetical protein n=1 Tax=Pseudomonas gessardii TaxID=78544 RepID=UPI001475C13C|nr:hypothetical protein [Pseudomonas gessardii]NNA66416.1 hypothetical protein [Pseudomonas gessardii]